MKVFFITFIVLLSPWLWAQDVTLVQLESQLEQRMGNLVHSFDPRAQVTVKVTLRVQKAILPGVTFEETDFTGGALTRNVHLDEIAAIDVGVFTDKDKLPDWLNTELVRLSTFKGIKGKIQLHKVELQQLRSDGSKGDNLKDFLTDLVPQLEGFTRKIFLLGLGSAIGLLGLLVAYLLRIPAVLDRAAGKLVNAIKDISNSVPGKSRDVQMNNATESRPMTTSDGEAESGALDDLSEAGAKALFADCFWSAEDNYAAWLWRRLDANKKRSLIRDLSFAYAYSNYLSDVRADFKNFHEHPYYLEPIALELVSNQDFEAWLKKQVAQPRLLSPVRLSHVHIPLKDRLTWLALPVQQQAIAVPFINSPLRKLPEKLGQMQFTDEDEKFLLEQKPEVSAEFRKQLPTWIWLWRETPVIQERILAEFNAGDLASAWVGVPQILRDLGQRMPEIKRKMVEEMAVNANPSRASWVFVDVLNQIEDIKANNAKNSGPEKRVA